MPQIATGTSIPMTGPSDTTTPLGNPLVTSVGAQLGIKPMTGNTTGYPDAVYNAWVAAGSPGNIQDWVIRQNGGNPWELQSNGLNTVTPMTDPASSNPYATPPATTPKTTTAPVTKTPFELAGGTPTATGASTHPTAAEVASGQLTPAELAAGWSISGSGALLFKPPLPTGPQTPSQVSGSPVTMPTFHPVVPGSAAAGANGANGAIGGTPAAGSTTIGSLASGNPPVPNINVKASPDNPYPLNISNYLDPMLAYELKSGSDTINNSQAAAGNLNSGDTLKQLQNYGMSQAAQSYNNAANIAAGQQNFAYGVDNNDRNFAYQAQTGDRNAATQIAEYLGQLGQGGVNNQANVASALARILSGNAISAGAVSSAGDAGNSAILANIINSVLNGGATTQPTGR